MTKKLIYKLLLICIVFGTAIKPMFKYLHFLCCVICVEMTSYRNSLYMIKAPHHAYICQFAVDPIIKVSLYLYIEYKCASNGHPSEFIVYEKMNYTFIIYTYIFFSISLPRMFYSLVYYWQTLIKPIRETKNVSVRTVLQWNI